MDGESNTADGRSELEADREGCGLPGGAEPIADFDAQPPGPAWEIADFHAVDVDPRLPAGDRFDDPVVHAPPRRQRVRFTEELGEAAAERRPHQLFAGARAQNDLELLAHAVGECRRVRQPAVGVRERKERPSDRRGRPLGLEHHALDSRLARNPGMGKQITKYGSHLKMRSSRVTMMISRINAHSVMIGIESEQIIPRLRLPLVQGPPSGTDRSLWNGHGSTE